MMNSEHAGTIVLVIFELTVPGTTPGIAKALEYSNRLRSIRIQ